MKRRWKKRGSAVTAAVLGVAGASGAASAQDFAFSPGVFFEFTIGDTWNVGLGLDVRGTALFEPDSCTSDSSQSGMGVYAQAVWLIHGNTARISAGLHGGFQNREGTPAWDLEAGWMWQGSVGAKPGGHGLQVGLLSALSIFDVAGRFNIFDGGDGWLPEGHISAGVRLPGPFGLGLGATCIEGRPQREGGGLCMGRVFTRGRHFKRRDVAGAATRAAVGRQWAEAARAEAASVPAFIALARDLTRAGAPQTLVSRALVAAHDEVRHARACAKVAQRYLGQRLAVEIPQVVTLTQESSATGLLARLAVESWKDGCLGEGYAAARAEARAPKARDPYVRRSLQAIAREEATHAELAWDVLAWATKTGGGHVKEAVARAVAETNAAPKANLDSRPRKKGQLDAAAKARIAEAVQAGATLRVKSVL